MRSASTPPMRKKRNEIARYRIPISWWFVVVSHRVTPTGPCSVRCPVTTSPAIERNPEERPPMGGRRAPVLGDRGKTFPPAPERCVSQPVVSRGVTLRPTHFFGEPQTL